MINIVCRTNLDLPMEKWPNSLPAVPRVGDHIQSSTTWGVFQLKLEVYNVTWCKSSSDVWYPLLELHIPKYKKYSIYDFYKWYAPLVGSTVGSFI